MLVLTRKKEESIMIGSDIEVRVLEIQKDHIRLGFSAPQSISIFRKEVFEEIQKENRLASTTDVGALGSLVGTLCISPSTDDSSG
jgi:carbon storage regulator